MTDPQYPETGARHPICANPDAPTPWAISGTLAARQYGSGEVEVIEMQDRGGIELEPVSVFVPREHLVILARGLMAAHVNAGRLKLGVDTPIDEG